MKRKNLVAMGLAGVMAVGMCMPVMAADLSFDEKDQSTGQKMTVEYEVLDKYTVTIPSTITFDQENKAFNITVAEKSAIDETKKLTVKIDSPEITLKTQVDGKEGVGTHKVSVKKDGATLAGTTETVVAEFDKGAAVAQTQALSLVSTDANAVDTVAGTYSGQITFTVGLEAITTPAP